MDLAALVPSLAPWIILRWRVAPSALVITVASRADGAQCPGCHMVSTSVHSHYTRTVDDLLSDN